MNTLSAPQAILLIGGLTHFAISAMAGYMLYWLRARDLKAALSPYAIITHRSTLINGCVNIGLAVAIQYTNFIPAIAIGLAAAAVLASLLSDLKNIMNWWKGHTDALAQDSPTGLRMRGLANMLNTIVVFALLYGVARSALVAAGVLPN